MPPKVDPNGEFDLYLRVKGGVALPAQSIAPKVGPYGLNPKMVGDKIMQETAAQGYKGIKVSIRLHSKQRQPTVFILPSSSTLIIKALKEGPRSEPKGTAHTHEGTIPFESIIDIAKQLRFKSYSQELSGTVREILGTCHSIGCNVNYNNSVMHPHDLIEKIQDGEVDVPQYDAPVDQLA
ncbi:Ribosomal protein L12 [Spironucleus salmonicida]|uniref:Ribosomal protein L12 n=1 Tax=Spironucleus salmonicida TaxID=348837 RepID=V6LV16_9EUKA|nr:Ribosomal protein L12 [Spironucleus salmonicida]|eukprot:EST48093.1 Ribosomal protein L12 [Spironucleus salmonicida]